MNGVGETFQILFDPVPVAVGREDADPRQLEQGALLCIYRVPVAVAPQKQQRDFRKLPSQPFRVPQPVAEEHDVVRTARFDGPPHNAGPAVGIGKNSQQHGNQSTFPFEMNIVWKRGDSSWILTE